MKAQKNQFIVNKIDTRLLLEFYVDTMLCSKTNSGTPKY